jgi:hypothetical protein
MGLVETNFITPAQNFGKTDVFLKINENFQECGSTLQRTTFGKVELQIPPLLCSKTLKGEVW